MKKIVLILSLIFISYTYSKADILVDDFEDGDNQTLLGAQIGGGYWYGYTDKNDNGNSTITPDVTEPGSFSDAISDDAGYNGKGVHVTFNLGDAIQYPYAAIGFNIGEEGEYYDLSKMESFEFWAKGSGEIYVCFKTYATDNTGTWGDMIYDLVLPSTWTKIIITPNDIVPEPWSEDESEGYTWSSDGVGNKVTAIHFKAKGNAGDQIDLYLDEINLLGVTIEDLTGSSTTDSTGDTTSTEDDNTTASSDTLWIDDFEDGDNQTLLGAQIGGGYWYGYTDKNDNGNSTIIPDVTDNFTRAISSDGGYNGNGVHVTFDLGDGYDYPYAAIGFNIGEEDEYYDLSKMESFEFWAKGSGEIYVCFKTYATDNTGTWGDMIYDLVLPSTWTKIIITPNDIEPEPYSDDEQAGYTWSSDGVGNKVTAIHFKAKGNAGDQIDLYLDEIKMLGVSPEDLGIATKVKENVVSKSVISLSEATPNPFNPITNIKFTVIPGKKASLKIYDAVGNLVKVLYNGIPIKSEYNIKWDGTDSQGNKVPSGVYFYRLSQNGVVLTKSVVFMK